MILALLGGLIIGLLLGMLGGGGAILAIPLLIYGFSFSATQATAASLTIVGIGALIGLSTQYAAGNVRLIAGISFGLLGIVGSFAGNKLSSNLNEALLLSSFAVLVLVVAITMILKVKNVKTPAQEGNSHQPKAVSVLLTATGVGFLTGFFGVGGGFAIVPALIFAMGFSMRTAAGTSLVVIAINSAVALAFKYSDLATVDWAIVTPIIGATIVGAFSGVLLAKKIKATSLQLGFAGFLIFISLYMAIQNFPTLLQNPWP